MLEPYQIRLFWDRVEVRGPDECHLWKGGKDRDGYGLVKYGSLYIQAHRLVWILTNGEIPLGIFVLHTCDNPPCCNLIHLFLGTHQDNMDDMKQKGRQRFFTGDNHPNRILLDSQVLEIRFRHVPNSRGPNGTDAIAREFGVAPVTIRQIVQGRTRKGVTK